MSLKSNIVDVRLIDLRRYEDERGYFIETYAAKMLGDDAPVFVQDNESLSRLAGTVRGLHFQLPPYAQAKLIRCVSGAILDVALDLRRNSPTFGHHVSHELSAGIDRLIYIPVGFAHGFCTLQADTVVSYKVSAPYSPEHDRGIAWNDPALDIAWPVTEDTAVLSDRDQKSPCLADMPEAVF